MIHNSQLKNNMKPKTPLSVEIHPDGSQVLVKNKRPCRCPFVPAMPQQSHLGRVTLVNQVCSGDCPHFTLYETNEVEFSINKPVKKLEQPQYKLELTCGGSFVSSDVQVVLISGSPKIIN